MKKIILALPALAAALLATSACAKHDDTTNTVTTSETTTTNDEIVADDNSVADDNAVDANGAGADPFANDTAGQNASDTPGNAL